MALKITLLRLEILRCLAYYGKLSKSMVERILEKHTHTTKTNRSVKHHRGEILEAFEFLKHNRLVNDLKTNPGPGLVYGRGRPKTYYEITYNALKLLITEDLDPLEFWTSILGYCHYSTYGISPSKMEELYQLFINNYLKFPPRGFSFHLDIFDNMCNNWLQEFVSSIDISVHQKVIEVLALHPKLTLKELTEKTKEDESEISNALCTYTLESYKPLVDENGYMDQNIIGKRYNKKYWDFLLHSVVIVKQHGNNAKTYELSLFGVILVLLLVRYNDMEKLKCGLYNRNISFVDYYDKIAHVHQDRLPLIFGKWGTLKRILRLFSAYNFDIILNKEMRSRESDKISVISGGNKELYFSIKEIVLQTRRQLGNLADAGQLAWIEYISAIEVHRNQDRSNHLENNNNENIEDKFTKVYPIRKKLNEIIKSLNPVEYISNSHNLKAETLAEIIRIQEEQFAPEISTLYYIHLYFDHAFYTRISQPHRYYLSHNGTVDLPISPKPKECLLRILEADKSNPTIKEWLSKWKEDILTLQKQIYETLHGFS